MDFSNEDLEQITEKSIRSTQPRGRKLASIGGERTAGVVGSFCAVQMAVNGGSDLLIFVRQKGS
jgi:hypothetical protein